VIRRQSEGAHTGRLAPARERENAVPALPGKRPAARVLKGRDGVDDGGTGRFGQRALERIHVESLVTERHALDVGAESAEDRERAVIARRFDVEARSLADEVTGDEVEALEGAVGHDDTARGNTVTLRDPFAERPVPAGGAVVESGGAVACESLARTLAEFVDRQEIGPGKAPGEGDSGHRPSLLGRQAGSERVSTAPEQGRLQLR
jgi:hypothetical protein